MTTVARLSPPPRRSVEELVGDAPCFRAAWTLAEKAAASTCSVLLLGETGVGKEMFSRALHMASPRAKNPFVSINCAALPEELIESELFGVEPGAYTGARESRQGRFERAHGGTLFLDEVAELSPSAQAKLLRVLQEGEFERVGDTRTRRADVRIIAATNVDLREAVEKGAFRRDLFYRLNIFPVSIPPLRERASDIPLLVERFVAKYAARDGKIIRGTTEAASAALLAHDWPGNVRELENIIERAVILAPTGGRIDLADLPDMLTDRGPCNAAGAAAGRLDGGESAIRSFLDYVFDNRVSLEAVEMSILGEAVKRANGKISCAARLIGISRPQLAYRLQKCEAKAEA